MDDKVYCVHCVHFLQHIHPFYPDEMMEACLSNPKTIGNYVNRKIEYAIPSEKNRDNTCGEYQAKFSLQFRHFLNKFLKKGKI